MRPFALAFIALTLAARPAVSQRPVEVAPNGPPDRPFTPQAWCQWNAAVRAMEPYVAKARNSYPAAKRRFLAGLPPRHTFFVTTRLNDGAGGIEQAFVAVDTIVGTRIVGRIWNDIARVRGYVRGQRHELGEQDLIDWMIARPDGSEEGNVVGLFIETWQPPACTDAKPPVG
jgi:uncharacterized protein YegJ (DUF2314 family)